MVTKKSAPAPEPQGTSMRALIMIGIAVVLIAIGFVLFNSLGDGALAGKAYESSVGNTEEISFHTTTLPGVAPSTYSRSFGTGKSNFLVITPFKFVVVTEGTGGVGPGGGAAHAGEINSNIPAGPVLVSELDKLAVLVEFEHITAGITGEKLTRLIHLEESLLNTDYTNGKYIENLKFQNGVEIQVVYDPDDVKTSNKGTAEFKFKFELLHGAVEPGVCDGASQGEVIDGDLTICVDGEPNVCTPGAVVVIDGKETYCDGVQWTSDICKGESDGFAFEANNGLILCANQKAHACKSTPQVELCSNDPTCTLGAIVDTQETAFLCDQFLGEDRWLQCNSNPAVEPVSGQQGVLLFPQLEGAILHRGANDHSSVKGYACTTKSGKETWTQCTPDAPNLVDDLSGDIYQCGGSGWAKVGNIENFAGSLGGAFDDISAPECVSNAQCTTADHICINNACVYKWGEENDFTKGDLCPISGTKVGEIMWSELSSALGQGNSPTKQPNDSLVMCCPQDKSCVLQKQCFGNGDVIFGALVCNANGVWDTCNEDNEDWQNADDTHTCQNVDGTYKWVEDEVTSEPADVDPTPAPTPQANQCITLNDVFDTIEQYYAQEGCY